MVNVSIGSASTILHGKLGMKRVFSKWMPYLFTMEQKQQRIDNPENSLALFIRNKQDFLRWFVTVDKTRIHHFTLVSTAVSWVASSLWKQSETSKKQPSAGKVMMSVSCVAHGIIHWLPWKEKIHQQQLLQWVNGTFEEGNRKKNRTWRRKKVIFYPDNAPCHKAMKTMGKLNILGFSLHSHPPYFPHPAPSDYWLFADLKKIL